MGKKKSGQNKKKVVLSLAEFTHDVKTAGVDPELAALPNAPKPAEEWDAVGGRPEYNSRGYKERSSAYRDRNYDPDVDVEDRDWTRKGPLDDGEGSSFGAGPERDWSGVRRGPLDTPETAAPARDWGGTRRGPVEAVVSNAGAERDWGSRKGPMEEEAAASRIISDDQWGKARQGPVEAEFSEPKSEPNWSVRKPIEAGAVPAAKEADWSARKGPVEAAFSSEVAEPDWTARKGPIEATAPKQDTETKWTDVRRRPVESSFDRTKQQPEVDWSNRKGPIDTEVEKVRKAVRDVEFIDKRGSKIQDAGGPQEVNQKETEKETNMSSENWRKESVGTLEPRIKLSSRVSVPSSSEDQVPIPKERDWGAARQQSHPVDAKGRIPYRSAPRINGAQSQPLISAHKQSSSTEPQPDGNDASDWTTVRAGQRKFPGSNRRNSGGSFGRRGRFEERVNSTDKLPGTDATGENKETTQNERPVAPAISEV